LTLNNFYKINLGSYSSFNIEKIKSDISLLKNSIDILELENRILEVEIASFSDEDEAIIGLARSERGLIKKGEQLVEFK
jgi:cell division protein FtsB